MNDKVAGRLTILAFFTTIVFHFATKMKYEAFKASQQTPRP